MTYLVWTLAVLLVASAAGLAWLYTHDVPDRPQDDEDRPGDDAQWSTLTSALRHFHKHRDRERARQGRHRA